MDQSQSWFKVTFQSYVCDTGALAELARSPQPASQGVFHWELKKKSPAPAEPAAAAAAKAPAPAVVAAPATSAAIVAAATLKSQVLSLMHEGVGDDVIVAYVHAHRLASPLTADEIVDWKKSGISDAILRATFPN